MPRTPDPVSSQDSFPNALDRGLTAAFGPPVADRQLDVRGAVGQPRYELIEEIGRGGIGAVFRARDRQLQREVAVKVLHEQHASRDQLVDRFVEEAQITGQLQHPGIVPVYETGRLEGDRSFIAMKLVAGRTLADLLEERVNVDTEPRRFLHIFLQVCQTVAFAHARNVVHRDLKPGNIMVGAFGEVQVLDWGFAKVLHERDVGEPGLQTVRSDNAAKQSVIGSVMGTPAYMPPEQARGEVNRIGPHSDVFALGAILGELLTRFPAYLESDGELLQQAATGDLSGAHHRLASCGAESELIALATECLNVDLSERPASAGVLVETLEEYFGALEERAERARVDAASARLRARATLGIAVLTLLVLVTAGIGYQVWQVQADQRIENARSLAREALRKATTVKERALGHGSEDLSLWAHADAEAERALLRAEDPDVPAALRTDAESLLAAVRGERAAAEHAAAMAARDHTLVRGLAALKWPLDDDILNPAWDAREARRLAASYESVLTTWCNGVSPNDIAVANAREAMVGRAVTPQLIEALDHWALACSVIARADEGAAAAATVSGKHLLAIANSLDDDPWREQLREVLADPVGMHDALMQLAAAADRQLPAASALILGHALWQAGRRQESLRTFETACDEHPHDPLLWVARGMASQRVTPRRWRDSVECYRMVRGLLPHLVEPQHRLGMALLHSGDLEGARACFERLASAEPEQGHWRVHLFEVLSQLDQSAAALQHVETGLRHDPDNQRLHSQRGFMLMTLNRRKEAEAAFEKAFAVKPVPTRVRVNLALSLGVRGDFERAVEEYEAILAVEEDRTAHHNLGLALMHLNRKSEAAEHFRSAIAIDPHDYMSLSSYGRYLTETRQYQEARKNFEKALFVKPDYVRGIKLYADMLRRTGEHALATKHLEHALSMEPDNARVHHVLANVLAASGKVKEAAARFQQAIELEPGNPSFYSNFGNLERRRGANDAALVLYDKAIAIDPSHSMAHLCRGLSLRALKRSKEAFASLHRAWQTDPDSVLVHKSLGLLYLEQKQPKAALKHYLIWNEANPRDPVGHYNLATLLVGDPARQIEALHHASEAKRLLSDRTVAVQASSREFIARRLPSLMKSLAGAVVERTRLQSIAAGELEPRHANDLFDAALSASLNREYHASAQTYRRAIAQFPEHVHEQSGRKLFRAARVAVLAAAASKDDSVASMWRDQAHSWLRAELVHWRSSQPDPSPAEPTGAPPALGAAAKNLVAWQRHADLSSVRSAKALSKLVEAEQQQWRALWRDVAATVQATSK